ncbi:MAG: hypothetical protein C0606_13465 [Hyphomicrobiales bacterium]|nr:MAG: hypothetical protein C0606_13465 [Hyphomicrobiales bacterium]
MSDIRERFFDADAANAPDGLSPALAGLWHAGRGDWDRAHRIVQDDPGRDAAWVHAYLHRVEGDLWNAGYWYRQAGRPECQVALEDEWREIADALLGKS